MLKSIKICGGKNYLFFFFFLFCNFVFFLSTGLYCIVLYLLSRWFRTSDIICKFLQLSVIYHYFTFSPYIIFSRMKFYNKINVKMSANSSQIFEMRMSPFSFIIPYLLRKHEVTGERVVSPWEII